MLKALCSLSLLSAPVPQVLYDTINDAAAPAVLAEPAVVRRIGFRSFTAGLPAYLGFFFSCLRFLSLLATFS